MSSDFVLHQPAPVLLRIVYFYSKNFVNFSKQSPKGANLGGKVLGNCSAQPIVWHESERVPVAK